MLERLTVLTKLVIATVTYIIPDEAMLQKSLKICTEIMERKTSGGMKKVPGMKKKSRRTAYTKTARRTANKTKRWLTQSARRWPTKTARRANYSSNHYRKIPLFLLVGQLLHYNRPEMVCR